MKKVLRFAQYDGIQTDPLPGKPLLDTIGDPVQCVTVIRGKSIIAVKASSRATARPLSTCREGCGFLPNAESLRTNIMHEFQVLAVFAVICAVYLGLFYASEHFFMKDKE